MKEELELIEKMEKNVKFIADNYAEFRMKFRNEFIAVEDGRILDHERDMRKLIDKLKEAKKDIITITIEFIPERGIEIILNMLMGGTKVAL